MTAAPLALTRAIPAIHLAVRRDGGLFITRCGKHASRVDVAMTGAGELATCAGCLDDLTCAYFDRLSVRRLASLLNDRLDPEDPGAQAEVTRLMVTVGWLR